MRKCWLLVVVSAGLSAQQKPVDFQREVRPILSDACYHCHGPDKGSRMANLRLDVPGPAVVAGKPEESKLWKRINHATPALRMPPPERHSAVASPGGRCGAACSCASASCAVIGGGVGSAISASR